MSAIYTVLKNCINTCPILKGDTISKNWERFPWYYRETVQNYRLLYTVLPQQYKHFFKLCKICDSLIDLHDFCAGRVLALECMCLKIEDILATIRRRTAAEAFVCHVCCREDLGPSLHSLNKRSSAPPLRHNNLCMFRDTVNYCAEQQKTSLNFTLYTLMCFLEAVIT